MGNGGRAILTASDSSIVETGWSMLWIIFPSLFTVQPISFSNHFFLRVAAVFILQNQTAKGTVILTFLNEQKHPHPFRICMHCKDCKDPKDPLILVFVLSGLILELEPLESMMANYWKCMDWMILPVLYLISTRADLSQYPCYKPYRTCKRNAGLLDLLGVVIWCKTVPLSIISSCFRCCLYRSIILRNTVWKVTSQGPLNQILIMSTVVILPVWQMLMFEKFRYI